MYSAQDLVNMGYVGYTGWGNPEAGYDFLATGGKGKEGGGGGFDYESEVQKAYGELGAYYDRVLKESRGDVNLALSRLVQDYERGGRERAIDVAEQERRTEQQVRENALARGLYQKSTFPGVGEAGFGIPDIEKLEATRPIQLAYSRYKEEAGLTKTRREEDVTREQQRREFDLEQQRRKEAGELAQQRAERSYQRQAFESALV